MTLPYCGRSTFSPTFEALGAIPCVGYQRRAERAANLILLLARAEPFCTFDRADVLFDALFHR